MSVQTATVPVEAQKVKIKVKPPRKAKRFPAATKNILALLALATPQEVEEGLRWYEDANLFCTTQAKAFGFSVEVVAGIVSALSPATDWDRNKADAIQVLANNRDHKFGTYGPNAAKAFAIRDVAAQERIDAFFKADKTFNFYQNIVNPSAAEYVTIDRHALSVALGYVRKDKSVTTVEYRELSAAYKLAARKAGMLPQQIQAITWCVWRTRKGYKSEFSIKDILN